MKILTAARLGSNLTGCYKTFYAIHAPPKNVQHMLLIQLSLAPFWIAAFFP